jgi:hypothetical protein
MDGYGERERSLLQRSCEFEYFACGGWQMSWFVK